MAAAFGSGIGMSVPGASDLGATLGGGLSKQVTAETDEERRKRVLMEQQQKVLPIAGSSALGLSQTGYSAVTG